jgi:hypothetical protein
VAEDVVALSLGSQDAAGERQVALEVGVLRNAAENGMNTS